MTAPTAVAADLDHRIRTLPERSVGSVRAVRREFSRRLRDELTVGLKNPRRP